MSEIETLLRRHTDSVDAALDGFEGTITTVQDAVKALQAEVNTIGSRSLGAHSRRAPIGVSDAAGRSIAGLPDGGSGTAIARVPGMRLAFPEDERKTLGAIMRGVATSAMRQDNDPDGGFLVPDVIRAEIEALVLKQSPIRRVARIVDFTSGRTTLPINMRGTTAGWVGEGEDRVETETPALAALHPPGGTVYALPRASEELIDDAIVNLEQFIEENVVDALAEKESQAFIYGDGLRKPAGFLSNPIVDATDATRPIGAIQYIPTGDATGIYGGDLTGHLLQLIFSMKAGYRQAPGNAWLASTDMISKLAQLTDGEGHPYYLPSLRDDVPGMLLGYPVIEAEHMPAVAPGSTPLAFGNWQRGYVIGDRTQLNVLRDPYTTKGQVKWYFRKRVYGAVLNSEAIKVLKVAVA